MNFQQVWQMVLRLEDCPLYLVIMGQLVAKTSEVK